MITWNPYTPGYFSNPYIHLKDCREQAPIHYGVHKELLFFKYKDVKTILKSPSFGVTNLSGFFKEKESIILGESVCPFLSKGTAKWLMYLNDKEHENTKQLIDSVLRQFNFNPVIETAVENCIRANKQNDIIDIVDISTQIPLYVIESFFGIEGMCKLQELKRFSHLLAVSQDIFVPKSVYREINAVFSWAFDFFGDLYNRSDAATQSNIVTLLKQADSLKSTDFTNDEIISILIVVFMAALETTKDSMSVILFEILKNPELSDWILKADDTAINVLSEELLRYVSPLQYTVRIANENCVISNQKVNKGDRLFLSLAAANRDPEIFEMPDSIIFNRKYNPHLSFGTGIHSCLGAKIARNEIRNWLKPVTLFLNEYKLDVKAEPVWQKTIFMRGMQSLIATRK